ncbi:MAG: ATP-dependent DNA helicase, partial [Candidatus Competibacteraceae bacterium]|nr:ATP-dependent DNA helicase [Candidatus Competibacteraceae bacterium]
VDDLPEDSPLWGRVTSTADNCLGSQCPQLQDCHVLKARRLALEADVLVINHHLLFADMAIREEGFAELLPGADGVILDEAHQLSEVAGQFFGLTLTARQLLDLARDTVAEQLKEAPDAGKIQELARALEKAVAELRLALGEGERRGAWAEVALDREVVAAMGDLEEVLGALARALEGAAPRSKGLENVHQRTVELLGRLTRLAGESPPDSVHWFETRGRGLALHLTPLEIAGQLRGQMERYRSAWILTSATLAVGEDFGHFATRLGLPEDSETLHLDSPFDFPRHGLLYHPTDLPDPRQPSYTRALVEAALPVLEASRGRAFLLFTSYRALREATELLTGRLDYPLLVQGSLPRSVLLERFKAAGNAVLLGTGSFWEGVDVRGPALSCVIIDKLPFASPGDPVLAARIDTLRRQGGNPFMEVQLPQAVIALKQGVGRLIRDVDDRGVLMLGDPRLLSRPYGQLFLDSLPPMTRTRRLERVQRFFALEQAVQYPSDQPIL